MSRWFLATLLVSCIIFDTGRMNRRSMNVSGREIHEGNRYFHRRQRPRQAQVILQSRWKSHLWTLKVQICLRTAVGCDSSPQCSENIEVHQRHQRKNRGIEIGCLTATQSTVEDYPSTGKE